MSFLLPATAIDPHGRTLLNATSTPLLLFCIELFTNPVRNIIMGFQGTMLVSDVFD
jgi:hypothetical protein